MSYIPMIDGFEASELPLFPPKSIFRPKNELESAIDSLPQVARGLVPSVPTPTSDRTEATSEADSDDSKTSAGYQGIAEGYQCHRGLEALIKRSYAVRRRLLRCKHSLQHLSDVCGVADDLDSLLRDCDRSAAARLAPLVFAPVTGPLAVGFGGGHDAVSSIGSDGSHFKHDGRTQAPRSGSVASSEATSRGGRVQSHTELRCLFHVRDGCQSTKKNMRDMIIHLRSHRRYYCRECSKCFETKDDLESHSHRADRRCIDVDCVNKPRSQVDHPHAAGCVILKDQHARRQWCSISRLLFPTSPMYNWTARKWVANVEVVVDPARPQEARAGRRKKRSRLSELRRTSSIKTEDEAIVDELIWEHPTSVEQDPQSWSLHYARMCEVWKLLPSHKTSA